MRSAKRIDRAVEISQGLKVAGISRKKFAFALNVPADRVYKVLGGFTPGTDAELERWWAELDRVFDNPEATNPETLDSYLGERHEANRVGEAQDITGSPVLKQKEGTDIFRVVLPESGATIGTIFPGKGAYRWQFRSGGKIKDSGPCESYADGLSKVSRAFFDSFE